MTDRELAELVKKAVKQSKPPRHTWYLMNASFGFLQEKIACRKSMLGIPVCFPLDDFQRLELEIGLLNEKAKRDLERWAMRSEARSANKTAP